MLSKTDPPMNKSPTQTEKYIPRKWTRKKSQGSNIYIRQKDFKTKAIKRDKDGHLKLLKGRIHQETINIVNIYTLKIGAPTNIRKILEDFKKDIESNTLILGDF